MSAGEILIEQITREMSLYIPIILLIFGSCGCLCNFITFTSKQLKKSSCAFYFLCTAIIELPTFYFGLLSRLANDRLSSKLFTTNPFYCKIRSYLIVALPSLVTYTILLSAIDRYMSTKSQAYYRSFSQLKVAYRATPIVILMTLIFSSHMLIFFDFYPVCTARPGLYAIIYSVYLILWTGILPNGLILLFSLLTYRNARRTKRRVLPSSHIQQPRHSQRTESHLMAMMLGQAILSGCLDLMRISVYAYFVLSTNLPKSHYHLTVDGLLLQISILLLYSNCSKSFYVYTLSSGLFRRIFRRAIEQYYHAVRHAFHRDEALDTNSTRIAQSRLHKTTGNSELPAISHRTN